MSKPMFLLAGKRKVSVYRKAAGEYVDGYWQDASEKEYCIQANVQPTTKFNDIAHLPEGERARKRIRVYTTFQLRTVLEGVGGWDADEIEWEGRRWRVEQASTYSMGVLDHTKAICVAIERV